MIRVPKHEPCGAEALGELDEHGVAVCMSKRTWTDGPVGLPVPIDEDGCGARFELCTSHGLRACGVCGVTRRPHDEITGPVGVAAPAGTLTRNPPKRGAG